LDTDFYCLIALITIMNIMKADHVGIRCGF